MMKYWPSEPGFNLNNQVAHLFTSTKQKFINNLSNLTQYSLYIDIMDNSARYKLFNTVLLEIELLILDLVELNLNINNIKLLNRKILYDLIQRSLARFLDHLDVDNNKILFINSKESYYIKVLSLEYELLLQSLLVYLVFGSSSVNFMLFAFDNIYTPIEHVSILLENCIIQISNIMVFVILDNTRSLSQIASFLISNKLSNSAYISLRSIAFFQNYLVYQNFLFFYINQPKEIYSARYKVWLISSRGLISKYIYASRLQHFSQLSGLKLLYIFLMEIQDLFIPQVENLFMILGKVLLYLFINVLASSIIFLVRTIISGFRTFDK